MKIKLFAAVLLTVFMLQFADANADSIVIAPIFRQMPPPPPRPPLPHIGSPFRHRHHRRISRSHGRISIHLPPHPQGPPPPPRP